MPIGVSASYMLRVTTSDMKSGEEWFVNAYIHRGWSEDVIDWIVDAGRSTRLSEARRQAAQVGRRRADELQGIGGIGK